MQSDTLFLFNYRILTHFYNVKTPTCFFKVVNNCDIRGTWSPEKSDKSLSIEIHSRIKHTSIYFTVLVNFNRDRFPPMALSKLSILECIYFNKFHQVPNNEIIN